MATPVLDQHNLESDYTYNPNFYGPPVYSTNTQTFTAGITGKLTSIDLGFFSFGPVAYASQVYAPGVHPGDFTVSDSQGNVLYTTRIDVGITPGNPYDTQMKHVDIAAYVTAGQMYSFTFAPLFNTNSGVNTGLDIEVGGTYSGGSASPQGGDYVFDTYVDPNLQPTPDPTPTPEPASLALCGVGVLGAGLLFRKRKDS